MLLSLATLSPVDFLSRTLSATALNFSLENIMRFGGNETGQIFMTFVNFLYQGQYFSRSIVLIFCKYNRYILKLFNIVQLNSFYFATFEAEILISAKEQRERRGKKKLLAYMKKVEKVTLFNYQSYRTCYGISSRKHSKLFKY